MLKVLLKTENGFTYPVGLPENVQVVDFDTDDDVQRIDYFKNNNETQKVFSYPENSDYETKEIEDTINNQFVVVWKPEDVLQFDHYGWLNKADAKEILEMHYPEYTTELIKEKVKELIQVKKQQMKI